MYSSVGGRIKWLLQESGLSESEFARKVKLPQALVNRMTNDKTKKINIEALTVIAQYFGLSLNDLLLKETNGNAVPLLRAEQILCANLETTKQTSHIFTACSTPHSPNTFATHINSNCMEPLIQEGSLLFIDPQRAPQHNNFVLYIEDASYLKVRRYKVDGTEKHLTPINKNYKSFVYSSVHHNILGVVIESRLSLVDESTCAPSTETLHEKTKYKYYLHRLHSILEPVFNKIKMQST